MPAAFIASCCSPVAARNCALTALAALLLALVAWTGVHAGDPPLCIGK